MAKDHDEGTIPNSSKHSTHNNNNKFKNIKKTAHMTRAMIRNLVADLNEEDKAKVFEGIMEDAGF